MPTKREQYRALSTTLRAPHQRALREHFTAQRAVGEHARTVLEHPGWTIFLDHLDQMRLSVETRKADLDRRMAESSDFGEGYHRLRLEARECVGELRALRLAMGLVPTMIERGQEAAKALTAMTAPPAGSA